MKEAYAAFSILEPAFASQSRYKVLMSLVCAGSAACDVPLLPAVAAASAGDGWLLHCHHHRHLEEVRRVKDFDFVYCFL